MNALALAVLMLSPARLYFQPDHPVPVKIAPGVVSVALLSPQDAKQATATVPKAGEVDLASLLPGVWDGQTHYVQGLDKAGEPVGSALVVVPLWPPTPEVRAAVSERRGGKPMGLRIYAERRAVLHTTEGDIVLGFSPEAAPNTVWNFMELVKGGLYTNVPFHRVVPGFVIQGGDPTGTGLGGPGYWIDLEASDKPHRAGTLSMARSSDPNSAGSQFFICLDRENCRSLDHKYAAFGDVVSGMNVVNKIAATPLADPQSGKPVNEPQIKSAELIPAPPRK